MYWVLSFRLCEIYLVITYFKVRRRLLKKCCHQLQILTIYKVTGNNQDCEIVETICFFFGLSRNNLLHSYKSPTLTSVKNDERFKKFKLWAWQMAIQMNIFSNKKIHLAHICLRIYNLLTSFVLLIYQLKIF